LAPLGFWELAREGPFERDVLAFGDDKDARGVAVEMAEAAGMRGLHGGALVNSAAAETLPSVLLFLNRQYADGTGIRITGIPE